MYAQKRREASLVCHTEAKNKIIVKENKLKTMTGVISHHTMLLLAFESQHDRSSTLPIIVQWWMTKEWDQATVGVIALMFPSVLEGSFLLQCSMMDIPSVLWCC